MIFIKKKYCRVDLTYNTTVFGKKSMSSIAVASVIVFPG